MALDPTFNGVFPTNVAQVSLNENASDVPVLRRLSDGGDRAPRRSPILDDASVVAVVASIGALKPEKLDGVSALLGEIPADVEPLLKNFDGARAVLFALLLDRSEPTVRRRQLETIRELEEKNAPEFAAQVEQAERLFAESSVSVRAAVARLAVPTLKERTEAEYRCFREAVFALCAADGRRDLFEFALQASVIRELDVWFRLTPLKKSRFSKFARVVDPFRTAQTYLAFRGADGDEAAARSAFAAGVSSMGAVAKSAEKLELESFENRSLERFYAAVERLAQTTPPLKERMLTAFFACVAADGRVAETEAELFDAISLALGVPAPVWSAPDLASRFANAAS